MTSPLQSIRTSIQNMEHQKIGAVARLGLGNPDVIPLWFGESDVPTPGFIIDAAKKAMDNGFTKYGDQRGHPHLRAALKSYTDNLYNIDVDIDRISAISSGMASIMIAVQCLVNNGDNVVAISPIWPNILHTVEIMGGHNKFARLDLTERGWTLDLDKLFATVDDRTKAIFIASPGNPSGWMASRDEQQAILDFARKKGIWIIADEVYARIVYDRSAAPSFLEIIEPDDRVFVVNSFSKSWAMTGWRLGWLIAPKDLSITLAEMNGYNNTGASAFVQQAGIAALTYGEDFIARMVERCRLGRDMMYQRLNALDAVNVVKPEAAFYSFFKIDGLEDSLGFAQDMVRDYKVGLAPGDAFGPNNESFLRLCFANDTKLLSQALDRIEAAIHDKF